MSKILSVSLCLLFGVPSFATEGKLTARQSAIRKAIESLHQLTQHEHLDATTPAFHDADQIERRRKVRVEITGLFLKVMDEAVPVSNADHKHLEQLLNDAVKILKETVLDTTEHRETRDKAVELLAGEYYSVVGVEALLTNLKEQIDNRRTNSGEDRLVSGKIEATIKSEESLRETMSFFGGPVYHFSLSR